MRIPGRAVLTLLLLSTFPALAQTYTPQAIRIDAPPAVDTAEALRIAALPTNTALTKQQIETALQRLADTGLFADVAYTVNSTALVIKLTPSASNQLQPARFSNFVWWQPAELETLLEAKIPAFHGQLPVAGTLTDQVKAALVSLLHAKGVDADVEAHQTGAAANIVTLSIMNPSILIGDIHFQNALPALQPQLTNLQHRLHDQDFDAASTTKSIQDSVNDIYENAGYLAVDTSAPTLSAPRKDLLNYAVDLTSTITPGDLYHVSNITLNAQPPLSAADLAKAANIKPGDIASPATQRLARAEMQRTYADEGYFDAKVLFTVHEDNEAHTVEYAANFVPGPIYHFASINTSALALDQQAAFAHAFTVAPGAPADSHLRNAIQQALQSLQLGFPVNLAAVPNPTNHTVKFTLKTAANH
jgi:outer membrane protein assembly factor BamA